MATKITYFVHGTTTDNEQHISSGWKDVELSGFESLDKSFEKLYGDGGYLFVFEREKFFHTEGLGDILDDLLVACPLCIKRFKSSQK